MIDLTTNNENTIYVVFNKMNFSVVKETQNEKEAQSMVFNNNSLEYSTYPSKTYAKNRLGGDLYETTFLEY